MVLAAVLLGQVVVQAAAVVLVHLLVRVALQQVGKVLQVALAMGLVQMLAAVAVVLLELVLLVLLELVETVALAHLAALAGQP